jgi:hypothetical protein
MINAEYRNGSTETAAKRKAVYVNPNGMKRACFFIIIEIIPQIALKK